MWYSLEFETWFAALAPTPVIVLVTEAESGLGGVGGTSPRLDRRRRTIAALLGSR